MIASRQALVVVIEDLHWADAATLDLLAHLGTRVQRMRMLVLASFRPDALHAGHPAAAGIEKVGRCAHAGRVDLAPLEGTRVADVHRRSAFRFRSELEKRRAIALAGEGNPFFTEELLKNAVQESAERRDRDYKERVPQSLRTTLLERLRPFERDDRRIVTQAAVIGRTFTLDLLAMVAGTEAELLVPTLRRARDFQLIEEVAPSLFRFRHGLTREAICSDFLRTELRPLHRRIGLALENAPITNGRSKRWRIIGGRPAMTELSVFDIIELAGDAARQVHAYDDAIAFYDRALEPDGIDLACRAEYSGKDRESSPSQGQRRRKSRRRMTPRPTLSGRPSVRTRSHLPRPLGDDRV